jgi:hypothetical protein
MTNIPGSGTSGLDLDSIPVRSQTLGSSTCEETKYDDIKPISNHFPSNLPNLRYLKPKASTREGLYRLLKTLPIGTLRVWAIEYSIPPIPKGSFAMITLTSFTSCVVLRH